jgi:hypothetical protein
MGDVNAVMGSLLENLDQIELVYKETYTPFQNDKGNTGDSKEYSIQEFIAAYLTSDYRIIKGCIYSKDSHSNNIDCVVLAPNHPVLTTPKRSIILAEGVYAAVEVKPDIRNKEEFQRGLLQIKSVKQLARKTYVPYLSKLMGKKPPADFESKIPSVIFAVTSLDPKDQIAFIKGMIDKGELTLTDLPDMILTLDHGLYVFSPDITTKPFGEWFLGQKKEFSKSVMLHFCETPKAQTLALFLLNFLNLSSPTLLAQESILNEYLKEVPEMKVCGYDFGK